MSIHPQYADAILSGEKTVEFRKRGFGRPVSQVLIYATAPEKRVLGYFLVGGIDEGAPAALWRRHGRAGCIKKTDFDTYYRGVSAGVAIRVQKAVRFRTPIPLSELLVDTAPQSFCYVDRVPTRA